MAVLLKSNQNPLVFSGLPRESSAIARLIWTYIGVPIWLLLLFAPSISHKSCRNLNFSILLPSSTTNAPNIARR